MEKLSVKDAMERLNVAETTIRRMIKRGDLPNIERENRKIWIPLGDIEAYEQKQAAAASNASVESADPPFSAAAVDAPQKSVAPAPQPVSKASPEPEEAVIISEPEEVTPEFVPAPTPHATIAQPIDELDDKTASSISSEERVTVEPPSEPVPYSPGTVQTHGEHEQSFKWIAVQAGILSTTWLEEIFHSIRVALEKYKKKSFPKSSQKEE